MKKKKKSTKKASNKVKTVKKATSVVKKKYKSYYKPKVKQVKEAVVEVPVVTQVVPPSPVNAVPLNLSTIKRPTSTKTTGNYLSKKELLKAVMESKGLGRMSDDLAKKLMMLVSKYARSAQFARYTFNDDMQGYAIQMLVRTWNSFDPKKSDNPFAFFTQCIKNSFIQCLNWEKKQRNIKDQMLVEQGMTPSYTYQSEYDTEMRHQLELEREDADKVREDTQHESDETAATE
jgi:hypothetical protein